MQSFRSLSGRCGSKGWFLSGGGRDAAEELVAGQGTETAGRWLSEYQVRRAVSAGGVSDWGPIELGRVAGAGSGCGTSKFALVPFAVMQPGGHDVRDGGPVGEGNAGPPRRGEMGAASRPRAARRLLTT